MSSLTVWDQVLSRIEDQVGKHSFSTWFKPTALLRDAGESLSIRVPNPLFVEWLPKHYSVVLSEALREVGRAEAALEFVPDAGKTGAATAPELAGPIQESFPVSETAMPAAVPVTETETPRGSLIPRYTF